MLNATSSVIALLKPENGRNRTKPSEEPKSRQLLESESFRSCPWKLEEIEKPDPRLAASAASMAANAYVARQMALAIQDEGAYLKTHPNLNPFTDSIFSAAVLEHLGNAVHTVTDMQSPWHVGFQTWTGDVSDYFSHSLREFLFGPGMEAEIGLASHMAMVEKSTFE